MAIQWAPLYVPLERRIQTLMALFWIVSLVCGGFIGLMFIVYLLLCTSAWPLALTYLIWMYVDRNRPHEGGRRVPWIRRLGVWKYYSNFFPLSLKKMADLSPDRNYLFCIFPHGLLSAGAFGHFGTESTNFRKLFPGLEPHSATLNMHFRFPIFREYLMALGAVAASKESITHILTSPWPGKILLLVVGGAAEALYAYPESYTLILKNRRGFVRMALTTGTPLVPVYSFGENDLFDQVSNPPGSTLLAIQNLVKKYTTLAPAIPLGRGILQYSFGPIPRRCPVTTVVGVPIEVPKVAEPSEELINEYHQKFIDGLTNLFETNKYDYLKDPEKKHLIIE